MRAQNSHWHDGWFFYRKVHLKQNLTTTLNIIYFQRTFELKLKRVKKN